MKDESIDRKQLTFALSLLSESQADAYATQCGIRESTVLERVRVATSLLSGKQLDKFTEYVAGQEDFQDIPEACKGGSCCGCKIGQREQCTHYIQTGIESVEQPSILCERKQRGKRRVDVDAVMDN